MLNDSVHNAGETSMRAIGQTTGFRSRRVVTPEGVRAATVFVHDGRIERVAEYDEGTEGVEDFGELVMLPGLVDTHVHLNEPGRTEWEGFFFGTRAAAAGGITTIVDMPLNCLPETTTVAALDAKRAAAAGKAHVDWRPWGGAVADNQEQIEPLAEAGVPGYKCFLVDPGIEGFTMIHEAELRAAMPHIARTGLPLLVHAELAGPLEAASKNLAGADWREYSTWLGSRPDEAELQAIELMIGLAGEFDCRIHIVHLATAQALPMLKAARSRGLKITLETCPHYLVFAAEEISAGATAYKCAPPIRSRENREGLWQGLRDGVIDLVATDHSPCPPEWKLGDFGKAWGGIASISVSLPVMWTAMRARGFSVETALGNLANWMCSSPAALAGIENCKGAIAVGRDADFAVFDPDAKFTLAKEQLYFRHAVSPYVGQQLGGAVKSTWLRGECIYRAGEFVGLPMGNEVQPGRPR
jgi:allantoinase